jgi:hypothetical protein
MPQGTVFGCLAGEVCFYYNTGFRNFCGARFGNDTNLGPCTNHALSVINNGTSCSRCQDVNLYWGDSYSGAWFCLPMGIGLPNLTQWTFDRAGRDRRGLGEELANNIASERWVGC